jgi:integrase
MIEFLASFPYAQTTKRTYTNILTRFLAEVSTPQTITAGEFVYYLEHSGWGNARQCLALACVSKYLRFQYGASHPALTAKIKRIKGKMLRSLTVDTKDILLASFDRHTPKGARDLAMASLMLQTGFRCSEICRLQQSDTDTEHGRAQVIVKGGSWEFGIFNPDTSAHIEHWKRYRETLNPQGGFLFVGLKSNHVGNGLTPEGLNSIVKQWGKNINIDLSPHDFRRTLATQASENGASDRGIMEAGRWHSQQVFTKYTRNFRLEAVRRFLPDTKLKEPV